MILFTHVRAYIVESECEREENRCIIRRLKLDLFCGRILVKKGKNLFIHAYLRSSDEIIKTHTQHISHCVVEATRIFHFCGISSHTHSSLGNNKLVKRIFYTTNTKRSKFYVQFLGNFLHTFQSSPHI